MHRITKAAASLVAVGISANAFGYGGAANVTFSFGGNSNSAGSSTSGQSYSASADVGWTDGDVLYFGGPSTLSSIANSSYYTTLSGYNQLLYYNPDFVASSAACAPGAGLVPPVGTAPGDAYSAAVTTRKYGCRWTVVTSPFNSQPAFSLSPVTDVGPVAAASGTLTVTDTTLAGILTIFSTTNEPTGGTATSIGNGTTGYNYRVADGSPFGNAWFGITTSATLQVALSGTFTATSWNITGGSVKFTDSGFLCQQGGFSSPTNLLCSPLFTVAGGYQNNGAHLSWGWDLDGAKTGTTAITQIDVRDVTGTSIIASLSGVLASLSIDGSGNITTNQAEFRRASGNRSNGCEDHLRYNGTKITCGSLFSGKLVVSGTAPVGEIPLPAAAWMFLGAGAALVGLRRRRTT